MHRKKKCHDSTKNFYSSIAMRAVALSLEVSLGHSKPSNAGNFGRPMKCSIPRDEALDHVLLHYTC